MTPHHDADQKRAAGILLLTRSKPHQFLLMRHHSRWDLPKGHCDGDESFQETALRETEEEAGLSGDQIDLDPHFQFELRYPVRYKRHGERVYEKHVVYFLGWIESVFTPKLTEHPSYQWFEWDPPHQIQEQTINPLLAAVAQHLDSGQH